MARVMIPTPNRDYLMECMEYDELLGTLIWKWRPYSHFEERKNGKALFVSINNKCAGKPALNNVKQNGYRIGSFDGVYMTAHRTIWKFVTGEEPEYIDHINGVRTDNRFHNLRSVPATLNARNMSASSRPDGMRGVYAHSQSGGWLGQINNNDGKVLSFYAKDRDMVVKWRKIMENKLGYITRGAK